jgi:hypothetical protein
MEVQMILTMDMATGQRLDEEESVFAREVPGTDWISGPIPRLALQEAVRQEVVHPALLMAPPIANAARIVAQLLH